MKNKKENLRSVFEYDNYRQFLSDFYKAKKAKKKNFSLRIFSKNAGFHSSNFLYYVMKGKRNLSLERLDKMTKALMLNPEEAIYYKKLVSFNQAKSSSEKENLAKEIVRSKVYKKIKPLAQFQFLYWAHWYNIVIREMAALETFQEDPHWIAKSLCPPITTEQARNSLKFLLEFGFLKRNQEGKLVQSQPNIFTSNQKFLLSTEQYLQYHQDMIERGKEALTRFPTKDRQISTVTVSLSEEGKEKIMEMINKFRKDLLAFSNENENLSGVYQINFQMFPVAQKPEKENK